MKTKRCFKVPQCSTVQAVKKRFNHSTIPKLLIKFPIHNLLLFAVICFALLVTPMVWAEGVIQLPQTGQTKCYDAAGAEITCTGTGQDGEVQAGVAWPNPRFMAGTGAEADCMTDNLTGLMWPKNGNLAGMKAWNDAIDYANNLTLCGHDDWRLPNINEMESLVNAGQADPAAWLNTQGFTNVQQQTYRYWSSTTYTAIQTAHGAWVTSVARGYVGGVYTNDVMANDYVWPVRSGQGGVAITWKTGQAECYRSVFPWGEIPCVGTGQDGDTQAGVIWPTPRFIDNLNNTVTDDLTGLVWTKDANVPGPSACSPAAKKTWQGALDYVKCLNAQKYLGYTDWRLPNRKELRSLADYSRYNSALPSGHPFTGVALDPYWSSTTASPYSPSGTWAWSVQMDTGWTPNYPKSDDLYVWPVRGQSGSFYDLIISKSGTGTITSSPTSIHCGSTCSTSFTSGTSVTLTAVADAASTFTGWSGDCSGSSTTCTVTMNASKNVTATFKKDESVPAIALSSGWNFISFPKQPGNPDITEVLKEISINIRVVWGYDNHNKAWGMYKHNIQNPSLTTFEIGKGYWMYLNKPTVLSVTSGDVSANIMSLYEGWNLIGYNEEDDADLISKLANPTIKGKWVVIWTWDSGQWKAKTSDLNPPLAVEPLNNLQKGKAYWIRIKSGVGEVNYNPYPPKITPNPVTLHFNNANIGVSSLKQVTLSNTGTGKLTISSIAIGGTHISEFSQTNNCSAISPNSSCTVYVTFKPTSSGEKSAGLVILSDDPETPSVALPLAGAGAVLNPDISISPTSYGFGNNKINASSSAKAFAVTNSGTANLTISSVAISGTNAGDFTQTSNCSVVGAGSSCTVNVIFKPTAEGTKYATLTISSDDPDTGNINISLSGTGIILLPSQDLKGTYTLDGYTGKLSNGTTFTEQDYPASGTVIIGTNTIYRTMTVAGTTTDGTANYTVAYTNGTSAGTITITNSSGQTSNAPFSCSGYVLTQYAEGTLSNGITYQEWDRWKKISDSY